MSTVLVTGATGFIGQALCRQLMANGWNVRGAVSSPDRIPLLPAGVAPEVTGEMTESSLWDEALARVDAMVHLAVHHHVGHAPTAKDIELFRTVNVAASRILALRAAAVGVRRLVYLSSAKVHGEGRTKPYSESDPPCPGSPYGASKWEAEQELRQTARENRIELCIVRPPLVYGPEVKANFLRLLESVYRGDPLPLGRVRNRRSLLYIGNLTSLVAECLTNPAAVDETFLVSDGEDCSTPELVEKIATAMGRSARLLPVPVSLLQGLGRISGKGAMVDRLCGSFTIDSGKLGRVLPWRPTFSLDEGLRETVAWFLHLKQKQ